MRRRFFVDHFDGATATLRGDAAHHLGRVLRAQPGQLYELSDGHAVWLARTLRVTPDAVAFGLVESLPPPVPGLYLVLLLSIVKFDRFEWALEKATELGAAEIVPLAAARSEKVLIASAAKRAARWRKILVESAQQARCLRPPMLRASQRPRDAFMAVGARLAPPVASSALKILLSERLQAPAMRAALAGKNATSAVLAIGPEGGWTDGEVEAARQAGFLEASLGGNILRTETAVIAALATVNYALGE